MNPPNVIHFPGPLTAGFATAPDDLLDTHHRAIQTELRRRSGK